MGGGRERSAVGVRGSDFELRRCDDICPLLSPDDIFKNGKLMKAGCSRML